MAKRTQNGNGAPQALTYQEKLNTFRTQLAKAQDSFAQVLPKHMTAERVVKITLAAISRTPLLLECTPASMLQAVMQASQLGLEPGSVLGHAYLVPYKRNQKQPDGTWRSWFEAQLIPGYRGLIELALRSGKITTIEARVVRERDEFEYVLGLDPVLRHKPALKEPGDMVAVYAIARLKAGGEVFEVMSRAEVDAIRKRSKAADNGPWQTDYDEMARKTVVRRIAKYLPLSPELGAALELENRAESGAVSGVSEFIDIPMGEEDSEPASPPSHTDGLAATLGQKLTGSEQREPGAEGEPPTWACR